MFGRLTAVVRSSPQELERNRELQDLVAEAAALTAELAALTEVTPGDVEPPG